MTELDLYKFLNENSIDMRWDDEILSTWIPHWDIPNFAKLVSSSLDEGGRDARIMQDGSVWIDLVPICEYYDIDPNSVFPKTVN